MTASNRQEANLPHPRTGSLATCPTHEDCDMRGLLALGLGVLFATGVAGGGDAKTDSAKLQGKWTGEVKGMKLELTFAKDTFTFEFAGKPFKGTVKLTIPRKSPGKWT